MPRPDCPRCGSDLVVAAASTTPSESVLELRSGTAPIGGNGGGFVHWLCRVCGHRWDLAENRELPADDGEPDREPVTTSALSPAAELVGARRERGTTLSEVASGTRIQERHLRALERDAPLEEFPSPAYARFFLREYAEYLRLDPAPLLREFDSRHAPAEQDAPLTPPPAPPRAPRPGWRLLAVLSVTALALIAILPSALRSDEPAPPRPPAATTTPPRTVAPEPSPTPAAREPSGVRAVLRLRQASWVQAVADGEVLEAATLEPGTSAVYRADELLELTLGNAGGVLLRVGGELVETGSPGDVVTFDLTWADGDVHVVRT